MTSAATALPNPAALQGQTLLPHWGLIRAQGADAARFLHGQLTQDFSLLGLHEARLAAFCSAKGRMLASFVGFKRAHDDVLLACHRDLLPATLKRLSLFVLRAQVRLSDASDAFQLRGIASLEGLGTPWTQTLVAGAADASRQETSQHTAQETPQETPQQSSQPFAHQIALYPAAGLQRALWVAPAGTAPPARGPLDPAHWAWLEVMSGIAMVTQPVVDAFVPQMLNYESVGGVNFKKGCYPGQEVVARSQFRGTLKRRTHLVASDAPLAVGQPVFHTDDAEQPCGTVAAAAAHPAGGWNALVCLQTSAANGGALTVDHAQGAALTLLPLPYPLLDDI